MPNSKDGIFELIYNNTQSLVALYNPATDRFTAVNTFGIRMFDLQHADELVSWLQSGNIWLVPPPDLPKDLNGMESIVKEKGYLEEEIQFQTPAGFAFWGLLRIDSLCVKGENHLLLKITNTNAFKDVELAALRNAGELQALFSNSSLGIIITDSQGSITNFSVFAEQQFGYKKEEVLHAPIELLIPHRFARGHAKERNLFMQHPQNRLMGTGRELYARRKDGSEFPVEVSLSHYQIDGVHYVIAFVVDISIRKKAQVDTLKQKEQLESVSQQVTRLNAELEKKVEDRTTMLKETLTALERSREELRIALEKEKELGELKSRFVTMASHEFRTPLSTILTSAHIIQQYTSSGEQEKRDKHIHKIQNAVQNLTFILEDFLSLEKLQEGLVQVKLEALAEEDLITEIAGIAEEMTPILKKGQSIHFTYESLPEISTDKMLLRNILINLISNATKYSPEDSVIFLNVRPESGHVKITIEDQGIGISPEDQKHLFERFFRASNAATIQGTGLGLHIVGRYLQLIDGGIEMKSEVGKGTTFTVVLHAREKLKKEKE